MLKRGKNSYRCVKIYLLLGTLTFKIQIKLLKLNYSLNEIKDLKNFKENNKLKILNVHYDLKLTKVKM